MINKHPLRNPVHPAACLDKDIGAIVADVDVASGDVGLKM